MSWSTERTAREGDVADVLRLWLDTPLAEGIVKLRTPPDDQWYIDPSALVEALDKGQMSAGELALCGVAYAVLFQRTYQGRDFVADVQRIQGSAAIAMRLIVVNYLLTPPT